LKVDLKEHIAYAKHTFWIFFKRAVKKIYYQLSDSKIKCTTLLKFEIWHSATCYDFCQINPNRLGVNIILQYAETWRTIVEGRSQRTHRLCIHQKCVTLTQTSTVELARNQNRWYVYTNVTPMGTVEMAIKQNGRCIPNVER
jgi:hypothetical protein